ncbi:MAG: aminotransferase class V-fold PLP-dependent enzyme [Nanoarchaeota archaeon]
MNGGIIMQFNNQNIKDKLFLFTPGPVNVSENVRRAICKEDICHREEEFDCLLKSIEDKLLKLFEIKETNNYRAVVITGSGTAANESILSSVVGDKNILILSNGEFGERLYGISKIHNQNTSTLKFDWGEQLNLEKIDAYLKNNKVDIISMVHHETSSGMLNPIEKIGELSRIHNTMFIVDCVSSAGAELIDVEKCNISFCSSSSSKAIGSYSGISFVIGKKQEFEKLKDMPVKTTYLNLYKFYHFINTVSQTPNTPAVHLFFAFEQALLNILEEGVTNRHNHIKNLANLLRVGMEKLDLKFLIDKAHMCSVLTTVHIPSHVDLDIFQKKLRDKKIIIYNGKGPFKNKVFQVGNIGAITPKDIDFFLHSLKEVLQTFEKVSLIDTVQKETTETAKADI